MSQNGNVYNGQWEAYKRDMRKMGFYQKIAYDYELKSILRRINPKKISFLRSIVFSALMTCIVVYIIEGMHRVVEGKERNSLFAEIVSFVLVYFVILVLMDVFVIRAIRNKKSPLSAIFMTALALTIISIPGKSISEKDGSWFVSVIFIVSFLTFEIFRELSYRGSKELEEKVKGELNVLAWDIKSDINGNFDFKEGLTPKCKIPLVEGELVYMEEPAIVSEISDKNAFTDIGGRFMQRIRNIDLSTPYSLLSDARSIWERTTCDISKRKGSDKRNQALRNKFENKLGTVLVTNKRVLFVGGEHGFQIQIASIMDFGSNSDMTNPMLTIESASGRRIMNTEGSVWLAMFIEKVKNESIRVNA